METFDYPSPSGNVKLILSIPDHMRDAILQASSFRARYFNNPWTLPSPSASMEGTGHPGMAMPLFVAKVAYNIVKHTSTNPDLAPSQELDPVIEPILAQGSLATQDPLDLVFPSDEAII
jgi:hypothetical protein